MFFFFFNDRTLSYVNRLEKFKKNVAIVLSIRRQLRPPRMSASTQDFTYLSYGLLPQMCATLLTDHVMFKFNTYRTIPGPQIDSIQFSFQKYTGITTGKTKHNKILSGKKYLEKHNTIEVTIMFV